MSQLPDPREKWISQIPALQLLVNLVWEYLTPEEALNARGGKNASVLLDRVLEDQLRAINQIEFRGHTEPFSEGNIATAIKRLKDERFDGLIRGGNGVRFGLLAFILFGRRGCWSLLRKEVTKGRHSSARN